MEDSEAGVELFASSYNTGAYVPRQSIHQSESQIPNLYSRKAAVNFTAYNPVIETMPLDFNKAKTEEWSDT